MKKIYIITYPQDYSILTLKDYLDIKIIHYRDLRLNSQKIFYHDKEFKQKNILLRYPYLDNINHNVPIYERFLHSPQYHILIDRNCMLHHPAHGDKLWQVEMFRRLNIPHPGTVFKPRDITKLNFPVVIKKRISSRGRGNFVLNNLDDLFRFNTDFILDSIFQEFIQFQSDYRILMIDNRIHWVVKRDFFLRGPLRRTAVFTSEKIPVTSLSPQVVDIAHNIFRAWEGDFLVFDLINTHKGPMVLEAGLFAQFQSKEVPDNNNTPKALAKLIKTRIV